MAKARGEVGTVRVQGVDLIAHADTDGRWMLTMPLEEGEEETTVWGRAIGSGDSLAAAKADARRELKKRDVEVSVPFKIEKRSGGYGQPKTIRFAEGNARKIHAGRSAVLVTIEGTKDEIGGGYSRHGNVWKVETPDEILEEHLRLKAEQSRLYEEQEKIEEEWQFDLKKAVRDAIESETDVQMADDEEEPEEIAPAEEVS